MRIYLLSIGLFLAALPSSGDSSKNEMSIFPFTPELGATKGSERVNWKSYGAGQWKNSAQIYQVLCSQCHEPNAGDPSVGPAILGRHYPAAALKAFARRGIQTMPPFFPSEISDQELDGLADWVEKAQPGGK